LNLIYLSFLALIIVGRAKDWAWLGFLRDLNDGIIPLGIPWFGALGGTVLSLYGVFDHNREWDAKWNYWHVARPLVGSIFGVLGFLIFVGLINATVPNNSAVPPAPVVSASPSGSVATPVATATVATRTIPTCCEQLIPYYVLAFLLGFREETVRTLIKRATDLLFGPGIPGVTPPPGLAISPSPIEFNDVTAGEVADKTVMITNTGAGHLFINPKDATARGLDLKQPGSVEVFKILDNVVEGSVLSPQSSLTFKVQVKSDTAGDVEGSLTINSNAGSTQLSIVAHVAVASTTPASIEG
jgi:hypothetical protein